MNSARFIISAVLGFLLVASAIGYTPCLWAQSSSTGALTGTVTFGAITATSVVPGLIQFGLKYLF